MAATLSTYDQIISISSAAQMLSQCSLRESSEVAFNNEFNVERRLSAGSTGSVTSRIQRRNALANLFEGIDLDFMKQLAEANSN